MMNNAIVVGAVAGFLAAARVDFAAFKAFKSIDDVYAYDWKIAAFRWAQGAAIGALSGLGFNVVI